MPTEPQIPKWICNESHPRTENEPPQKDLVIEARAALAKMSNGTRIREAQLAPLLNESRELLRQLCDEVERLRELVRHMQFPQGG